MSGGRTCGGCTMCCKLLGVVELDKPMGVWCAHALKGSGCAIYEQRPQTCRTYDCFWLTHPEMADYWKPDRSRMVVTAQEGWSLISILVDAGYPDAWRKHPYYADLKAWSERSDQLQVVAGKRRWMIFPEEDLFLGDCAEDDAVVAAGYRQHRLMRQPTVSLRRADGSVSEIVGGLYRL